MSLTAAPVMSPIVFATAPTGATNAPEVETRAGVSLIHLPHATLAEADSALKTLRGFRVSGRRVVWCELNELSGAPAADMRTWGRKLVELGGAETVVAVGSGSRDLAIAARDAGLPLGRVVVCRDDATARNVLGDTISHGDVVLALGVEAESCERLLERLEAKAPK